MSKTANNDHTGDPLKSKLGNQAAFSAGYDMIFGKKSTTSPNGDTKDTQCQKSPHSISHSSSESQPV